MKKRGRIIAFLLIVLIFAGTISTTVTGISKKINLGLDLQGGFEILYEVEPVDKSQEVDRTLLEATVQTLNDRVNRLGISETVIDIEGEDRIRVQLAGVEDQETAREMLSTSALLSFRDVNDKELLAGSDIKEGSAKQDFDPNTNKPMVTLQLKDANKFGQATTEVLNMGAPNNLLVIWMDFQEGDSFEEEVQKADPKFISAPSVSEPLHTTNVQITGNFTVEEAQRLADIINAGSLPVHMTELYSTSVGAQFGEKALNQTVFAGIIGISIIFLFMIIVYRFPGFIAGINVAIYIYLILLVFQLMNGVLTLPGIAALILGVGMAVDANVLTFERIKEELRQGKSVVASFKAGGKNSLVTILDANITTMLAAAVLFIFGTSSIKGFATMLIVSILVSFLTAVYGTRLLLGLWVNSGFLTKRKSWFGVKKEQIHDISSNKEVDPTIFNHRVDIVKHRKKIFMTTIIITIIGTISLLFFKLNPGIDFTSGSRVEVLSDTSLTTIEIEEDLQELGLEAKSIVLSGENSEIAVIRYDSVLADQDITTMKNYFTDKYVHEPSISVVSPIVGQELVKNAIYALAIASIGMVIYVTLRFEFFFAITAIITLLHDVFFMLVIFSITRIEFDVTIVAAILTIVGYAINNTIVVFDRIRENIRAKNKRIKSSKELAKIINDSLIQTFMRSINTTITTLIAVFAFLILGAQSIFGFAIALVTGLIAGAYSSLFLASQLWLAWRGNKLKNKPIDFRKKKRVEGPQV
ncbi:protein translocase subunit SecDF [Pseudogracilibacillus auburnensis]|uniref:Multifunctional fusion protein n=1 Tax=Pseudogracilibacillus auburnensis TaxID=1494959 RepID=A0A2V3VYB0_9BACI|nr:protein translocase subunit SecDF [Pseudogracilibacillus auburnensis]MBO1003417.1 protein translocase subunit SecDF [Pseudogracilibacillus auburnensis]PXW86596.1 protein translocase subunit secF /protein translocase subunit secD [Pseudogracilibacillus auburnensis]